MTKKKKAARLMMSQPKASADERKVARLLKSLADDAFALSDDEIQDEMRADGEDPESIDRSLQESINELVAADAAAELTGGAWAMPPMKHETAALFALAAVLSNAKTPIMAWRARLAALLAIDAARGLAQLTGDEAQRWQAAIGSDQHVRFDPVALDDAVADALEALVGRRVVNVKPNGTLEVVATLPVTDVASILERARFMERATLKFEDDAIGKLRTIFPTSLRDATPIALRAR